MQRGHVEIYRHAFGRYSPLVTARRLMLVAERVSRFLAERRLASFVITSVVILLMADAIRKVLPNESDVNVFTWIALALMVYAVIATVVLLKRVTPRATQNVRLMVAWSLGLSPSLYGFAAVLSGSPVVLMWLGVLVSLSLVAWLAINASSVRRNSE